MIPAGDFSPAGAPFRRSTDDLDLHEASGAYVFDGLVQR